METKKEQPRLMKLSLESAYSLLLKMVLLDFINDIGKGNCYRCKKPIRKAKELAIDHVKPWYQEDPTLFWDLSNIVFSHKQCSRSHKLNLKFVEIMKERT